MAYPLLKLEVVDSLKELYKSGVLIKDLQIKFNLNYRTVVKYIKDVRVEQTTDARIVEIFMLCGSLQRTSNICSVSKTTVWRALKRSGVATKGVDSWKRLYRTLRMRVIRSKWRLDILQRDNFSCIHCSTPSRTVHHITKLSDIRDIVLKSNPNLNPFRSFKELRAFTDTVMEMHNTVEGITLCNKCHDKVHSDKK